MGGQLNYDIVGSLLARSVSVPVPKNGSILAQFLLRLNWSILVRFTSNFLQVGSLFNYDTGKMHSLLKIINHFMYCKGVKRVLHPLNLSEVLSVRYFSSV